MSCHCHPVGVVWEPAEGPPARPRRAEGEALWGKGESGAHGGVTGVACWLRAARAPTAEAVAAFL